ncbi:ring-opening amidohydrolase [Bradyrhizobium sp. CCBAU 53415]|uniref:ring-opening amidohydrolase n=1 Tax=Bradyrhizobium sp. CCBAU 53415 TaxID=1325119 RepID=UPI002306B706|nr:ring-opening amidohydrolase [Bradyrhizobium sp. CCBAU 53415]
MRGRCRRRKVSRVVRSVIRTTVERAVDVSGGAEHRGPPDGGPVAAIARLSD